MKKSKFTELEEIHAFLEGQSQKAADQFELDLLNVAKGYKANLCKKYRLKEKKSSKKSSKKGKVHIKKI